MYRRLLLGGRPQLGDEAGLDGVPPDPHGVDDGPRRIEVTADPSLAPGSAILESTGGSLDASVDTQLHEIERGFADLARRAS